MRSRPLASSVTVSSVVRSTTGENACAHSISRETSSKARMQANMRNSTMGLRARCHNLCASQQQSGPDRRAALHFDDEGGAGPGVRFLLEDDERGRGMLDGAAQAEPRSERDPAGRVRRHVPEIENHQAESARLNQQVGDLQRALGIAAAAYPEQAVE